MADVEDNEQDKLVEVAAEQAVALELSLAEATNAMMQNPEFRAYLEEQKEKEAKLQELWKRVEELMIAHDIKSIKSKDWGSLTIVERTDFKCDLDILPRGMKKLVPDTTKIRSSYVLTNKLPNGAEVVKKKFLQKRLKFNQQEKE